jgi:hypothetical protein
VSVRVLCESQGMCVLVCWVAASVCVCLMFVLQMGVCVCLCCVTAVVLCVFLFAIVFV